PSSTLFPYPTLFRSHSKNEALCLEGFDGESVGVRDRHLVLGDAKAESGVAASIDGPQPDPLSGLGGKGLRVIGGLAVDQVEGVVDVACVAAEQRRGRAHEGVTLSHRAHCNITMSPIIYVHTSCAELLHHL